MRTDQQQQNNGSRSADTKSHTVTKTQTPLLQQNFLSPLHNGPISGLTVVYMAVLFLPHATGRVACVTLPHQEVLLDVSPYTDFLPDFDVHL
jgi:hypothetical protein